MSRRNIQVFNMSFLDMMTNFLGAVIILLLIAMKLHQDAPCPTYSRLEKVHCDSVSNNIFGRFESTFSKPLKAGDTLLVVVSDFAPMPGGNKTAQQACTLQHYPRCTREHNPPCPPCPQDPGPNKCAIVASAKSIECNDGGTPADAGDDTYTFEILVRKVGACGTSWRDSSGVIGQYDVPKRYGPFKTGSGGKRIRVTDLANSQIKSDLVYVAAPSCSTAGGGGGGGDKELPGKHFTLTWDDESDNVNLYVQKDNGAWLYGGRPNDASMGSWTDFRKGMAADRTKIEDVTIKKAGRYKIFGHFSSSKQKRGSIKVRLNVSSSTSPRFSQTYEFTLAIGQRSPKNRGAQPLKEVEILPDGTIRILR